MPTTTSRTDPLMAVRRYSQAMSTTRVLGGQIDEATQPGEPAVNGEGILRTPAECTRCRAEHPLRGGPNFLAYERETRPTRWISGGCFETPSVRVFFSSLAATAVKRRRRARTMSWTSRIAPRIAAATVAAGLILAAAAPSANATRFTWLSGYRAPGTPLRLDKVGVLRFGPST